MQERETRRVSSCVPVPGIETEITLELQTGILRYSLVSSGTGCPKHGVAVSKKVMRKSMAEEET